MQKFRGALAASWANAGSRMGMFTIAGILAYPVFVTWLAERRMRAAGADLDDRIPAE